MKKERALQVQDQIIYRRPMLFGRGAKEIKVGTILAFADNGTKAVVSFPADRTRLTISLDELEPASKRFGRARVEINPVRRAIGGLW
jgi:hypothetical protein